MKLNEEQKKWVLDSYEPVSKVVNEIASKYWSSDAETIVSKLVEKLESIGAEVSVAHREKERIETFYVEYSYGLIDSYVAVKKKLTKHKRVQLSNWCDIELKKEFAENLLGNSKVGIEEKENTVVYKQYDLRSLEAWKKIKERMKNERNQ